MNKRILLLTPAFPPYGGSHTQRMIAIANTIAQSDIDVLVLTYEIMKGHPSYNPKSLESVDERIKILRVKCGFFHYRAYSNTQYIEKKYMRTGNESGHNGLKERAISFFDKIKDTLFIPDSIIDWKHNVLSFCRRKRLFSSMRIDYIYSSAMPCSMHVIGYKLSKKYKVPLIMDYGDPWVFDNGSRYRHHPLKYAIEKRMEKKITSHAKAITFSTLGCEELYQKKFSLPKDKTLTMMTGFEERLLSLQKGKIMKKGENAFVLTYGGAIQSGVRNPVPLLKALEEYPQIEFLIRTDRVSELSKMVKETCPKASVTVLPYVPFDEYYKEMLAADGLVFFGNSTSNQLPGKIFNYLPTGKPILYVSNIEKGGKDQALDIVKDYGYYVMMENNYEGAVIALKQITELKQHPVGLSKKIEQYSNYNQCKIIADWIKAN